MILGGGKSITCPCCDFFTTSIGGSNKKLHVLGSVREKNESEQDFKRAWDDFRAANSDKVRFPFW
jgi:hypothetical protein